MSNPFNDDKDDELKLDSADDLFNSDHIDFDEIGEDLLAFQEDEMVQQALHRGVDLKKYGDDLEKELKIAENDSVTQYVDNSQQVIDLHKQMQECDAVLSRMQEMLLGFQADLGGISEEIKHLQDESLSMSIRLKNRRSAEEKLHKFLNNCNISPDLASNVINNEINDVFIESVLNLSSKITYLQQTVPAKDGSSLDIPPSETYTGKSLLPELEKLKVRVISKAREYFTTQFNNIRKPKTNVQIIQQQQLVKYSTLFHFVQDEALPVADDLRNMYIECMGRTLQNLFKSYMLQLVKFDQLKSTKTDLIVIEEVTLKSIFATQKVVVNKSNDAFTLTGRDKVLDQIEDEPILIHVASAENKKYSYELILRSVIKHLSDAATNEFLFILDFFKTNTRDSFNRIFGRTLSLILENLENYLLNCYDAVGLLLMIKVTHSQRMVMQRRRIPVLDSFFDRISMLLWPRFKFIFDCNLKSIKNANHMKLCPLDLTPHSIAQRYGELAASVLILQSTGTIVSTGVSLESDSMGIGGGGENMLQHDIVLMRNEMISLLKRMSTTLSTDKEKKVFTINNYDCILTIFQERGMKLNEEMQIFDDLTMQQRESFSEDEIRTSFPRLISFVTQTEVAISEHVSVEGNNLNSGLSLDEALVEGLVREFASNWRTGIQQINDNCMSYFTNFLTGMEILKQVLTQLLLYYTRFQDIIKKSWSRPPVFSRDIVSTATILMEIKKISNRTF